MYRVRWLEDLKVTMIRSCPWHKIDIAHTTALTLSSIFIIDWYLESVDCSRSHNKKFVSTAHCSAESVIVKTILSHPENNRSQNISIFLFNYNELLKFKQLKYRCCTFFMESWTPSKLKKNRKLGASGKLGGNEAIIQIVNNLAK